MFRHANAPNRYQRIVFSGGREFLCRPRQFERARNMHDVDIFVPRPCAFESIRGSGEQAVGNKAVEAADDNPEAHTRSSEIALHSVRLEFLRHLACESFLGLPRAIPSLLYLPLN